MKKEKVNNDKHTLTEPRARRESREVWRVVVSPVCVG